MKLTPKFQSKNSLLPVFAGVVTAAFDFEVLASVLAKVVAFFVVVEVVVGFVVVVFVVSGKVVVVFVVVEEVAADGLLVAFVVVVMSVVNTVVGIFVVVVVEVVLDEGVVVANVEKTASETIFHFCKDIKRF